MQQRGSMTVKYKNFSGTVEFSDDGTRSVVLNHPLPDAKTRQSADWKKFQAICDSSSHTAAAIAQMETG